MYGWRWDHGGRNSYRMGAEGKFDLKVVSGGATGGEAKQGRKSHSTPSLPDATAVDHQVSWLMKLKDKLWHNSLINISINVVLCQVSVASTEQASSADNISSEEMASNMSRPRTHATDLSAINNSTHHINTGANLSFYFVICHHNFFNIFSMTPSSQFIWNNCYLNFILMLSVFFRSGNNSRITDLGSGEQ